MRAPMHYVWVMTMTAAAATAQVRLPAVPVPTLPLQALPQTLGQMQAQSLDRLNDLRRLEIRRLIRTNRRVLDADPHGEPVIRDEILALSPTDAALSGARSRGFIVDRQQVIEAMNIRVVVFKAPPGMSTKAALRTLREADPGGSYDYNHIYSSSGAVSAAGRSNAGTAHEGSSSARVRIGLLDTGIDVTHPVFRESVIHAWGCGDHVVPAAHGTAVASLLIGRSTEFQGVRPGAELYAADVYCGRPTGGAVDALVAAFAWLVRERVPVINVSLVGPKNALLETVIGSLVGAGYIIVAAVGNDGPAAPPLYPASYPHVVGVTAVDAHGHVLIEAARGPQVMFASPGAELAAAGNDHGYAAVRGTSFAAPIVAALLASDMTEPDAGNAEAVIAALAKTAVDLGPPGRDLTYGFGLVGADHRIDPATLDRR
ncbi:MAG TPA: S8 family serine peptidase [Steroidobacteraceae bacterium]|nr:S8 family serine peptidase [Steroidobacteraceae bacterium]